MSESPAAVKIQKTIVNEAKATATKMIDEAEVAARVLAEQANENARLNLAGWMDRRRQMAENSGERIIGKARNDAHMKVLDAKAQLINEAFEKVQKQFEKERTSAQYKTFLKNLIISAGVQIGGSDIVIKTRKEDQATVSSLKGLATAISTGAGQSTKVTVAKQPMDMIGGVFIQNKEGNITVDYRIETLLAEVAQQRRNEIAKMLFSEKAKPEPANE
jgi:vacuolar-type H+-ATPase subunit E/Vma4